MDEFAFIGAMISLRSARRRGFTLVELMIVVAVIGVLAAIAAPKFSDLVKRSQEGALKGNLSEIRSALSIYYADHDGMYAGDLETALLPRYLSEIPVVTIPATTSGTNPGHINVGDVMSGAEAALSDATSGVVWFYVNQGTARGTLLVNCSHLDTRGSAWTSY